MLKNVLCIKSLLRGTYVGNCRKRCFVFSYLQVQHHCRNWCGGGLTVYLNNLRSIYSLLNRHLNWRRAMHTGSCRNIEIHPSSESLSLNYPIASEHDFRIWAVKVHLTWVYRPPKKMFLFPTPIVGGRRPEDSDGFTSASGRWLPPVQVHAICWLIRYTHL